MATILRMHIWLMTNIMAFYLGVPGIYRQMLHALKFRNGWDVWEGLRGAWLFDLICRTWYLKKHCRAKTINCSKVVVHMEERWHWTLVWLYVHIWRSFICKWTETFDIFCHVVIQFNSNGLFPPNISWNTVMMASTGERTELKLGSPWRFRFIWWG